MVGESEKNLDTTRETQVQREYLTHHLMSLKITCIPNRYSKRMLQII